MLFSIIFILVYIYKLFSSYVVVAFGVLISFFFCCTILGFKDINNSISCFHFNFYMGNSYKILKSYIIIFNTLSNVFKIVVVVKTLSNDFKLIVFSNYCVLQTATLT